MPFLRVPGGALSFGFIVFSGHTSCHKKDELRMKLFYIVLFSCFVKFGKLHFYVIIVNIFFEILMLIGFLLQ